MKEETVAEAGAIKGKITEELEDRAEVVVRSNFDPNMVTL